MEWKGRVYVPVNIRLHESLIAIYHSWGHSGVAKTVEALTRDLWWPNMKKDVEKYIPGCEVCQKAKPDRQPRAAPLHPNEIPKEPWEVVSVDLIGPLPESKGNDMILVIVDRFTKKSYFLPTTSSITSQGVAVLFRDNVFRDHGIPRKVISDRGTQFVSKFMDDLYGMLGIKANRSTAYHPQTDGQTERVNQEVKEFLTMFVNHQQDNWSDWLAVAQFCHNDRIHSSTGYSPFFMNYGRHPNKGLNPTYTPKVVAVEELAKELEDVHAKAKDALIKTTEVMKKRYDETKATAQQYQPGDKVYLSTANLPVIQATKKLDGKFVGPLEIVRKIGESVSTEDPRILEDLQCLQ